MSNHHAACAMSFAVVAASCLSLPAVAIGECVMVEPPASAQKLHLTVLQDGKPAPNVNVTFHQIDGHETLTSRTNRKGIVTTKTIPTGTYEIVASSPDAKSRGELLVQIVRSSRWEISSFSVDLSKVMPKGGGLKWGGLNVEQLATAVHKPVSVHLQEFSGVVMDPSGAPIPGANIVLVDEGVTDAAPTAVKELKSGADGRFSAQLPDGIYAAFFQMGGFNTKSVTFEINSSGLRELLVALLVSAC